MQGSARNWVPSSSTRSSPSTWRWARPYTSDPLPAASVEIMPPTVARLRVEVWGAQCKPWGASSELSRAVTMPGSTTAVRPGTSSETRPLRWRFRSTISPDVRLWPLVPVPPPRAVIGWRPVAATRARTSAALRGRATPSGSTW
ncbi:MAG: hypothetical protein R2761_17835 [Acidimicrobiales bacterium]